MNDKWKQFSPRQEVRSRLSPCSGWEAASSESRPRSRHVPAVERLPGSFTLTLTLELHCLRTLLYLLIQGVRDKAKTSEFPGVRLSQKSTFLYHVFQRPHGSPRALRRPTRPRPSLQPGDGHGCEPPGTARHLASPVLLVSFSLYSTHLKPL